VEAVLLRRKGLGTKPWVDQELDRLHKTRTAVEAVVNARELKDEVVAIAA
jgi:hypothetical protein